MKNTPYSPPERVSAGSVSAAFLVGGFSFSFALDDAMERSRLALWENAGNS